MTLKQRLACFFIQPSNFCLSVQIQSVEYKYLKRALVLNKLFKFQKLQNRNVSVA